MPQSIVQGAKNRIPEGLRPPLRRFYHHLYRAWLRVQWRFLDFRQSTSNDVSLPLPPAKLRFRVAENAQVINFFTVGRRSAEAFKEILLRSQFRLTAGKKVLDLGCGCGRTLMWLMREFPEVQWTGSDIDAETIEWCRRRLAGGTFTVNGPLPPLSFADDSFDCVYGISLFTHLSEPYQQLWLRELHRVLRPGGLLILTLHSQHVWKASEHAGTIEREGVLFCTSKKLEGILPDWYQTTFQTRSNIVKMLSADFEKVDYLEHRFGAQDATVAWKPIAPAAASTVLRVTPSETRAN